MSKILTYTVSGYLPYDTRELLAGDQVDIPITAQVIGVPESIRALVQSVEETTISGVEGRIYSIEYDETLLGGNLNELDQCCHVGLPTAVTCCVRADELNHFLKSERTSPDSLKTVTHVTGLSEIPTSSTTTEDVDVSDFLDDLGLTASSDHQYSLNIEVVVTTNNSTNGQDSYAEFVLVGQPSNGATLIEKIKEVGANTSITATRVGESIHILAENSSATHIKKMFVSSTFKILTPN